VKKRNGRRTIALLAHDGKKALLAAFVREHLRVLRCFNLIGTGNTSLLVRAAGLNIRMKRSGPMGGDAQIASEVIAGRCDAVLFFRDPMVSHPHDADIAMLMRNCDVYNIPLSTNVATAELILKAFH
jgi:methylglyoxal synthase